MNVVPQFNHILLQAACDGQSGSAGSLVHLIKSSLQYVPPSEMEIKHHSPADTVDST